MVVKLDPSVRIVRTNDGGLIMTDHQRFQRSPFRLLIIVSFLMLVPVVATAQVWTVAAGDPKGDVRDPSLADAAPLTYRFDKQLDFLWFRVALYGVPNDQAFGVNVAVDTGAEESAKTDWWGGNKAFRFDKLVTAWVTRNGNGYQGTIGVGDAAGVNMKKPNNLRQDNLQIKIDGDA